MVTAWGNFLAQRLIFLNNNDDRHVWTFYLVLEAWGKWTQCCDTLDMGVMRDFPFQSCQEFGVWVTCPRSFRKEGKERYFKKKKCVSRKTILKEWLTSLNTKLGASERKDHHWNGKKKLDILPAHKFLKSNLMIEPKIVYQQT